MTEDQVLTQLKEQSRYFADATLFTGNNMTLIFGRNTRCQVTIPLEEATPQTLKHVIQQADRAVARELLSQCGLTVNALVNMKIVQDLNQIRNTILSALGLSPEDLDLEDPGDMKCNYDLASQDLSEIQWALNSITDQCRAIARACIVTPIMEEE